MVELKSPEAQHLQQQQDLHLSDLQQHMVIWQQPAFDKEVPQNQVRLHLMETLQGKEVQGKVEAKMSCQEVQETQGLLETVKQQKQ